MQGIVSPDQDDQADHIVVDELTLKPITRAGDFTVTMLDLNRKSLRDLRRIRRTLCDSEEHIMRGLAGLRALSIEQLPTEVRGAYIAALTQLERTSVDLNQQGLAIVEGILKTLGRSTFLDRDPEARERAGARRGFLAELKAVHGDSFRGRKTLKPKKSKRK